MAQRLPVPRINTGPQALRYRQRRLKLPVYTTTNPATASLTDTFDTLDAAKWANWGAASVSNGLLSCVPSNAYNGGISSIGDYDLTGSTVSVQVISPCGPGASTENWIQVSSDSNQAFRHALLIKGNQHYSDDFNRADGALGAGWTTQSTPAPVIYNNQMVAPQAGSWAGANINQWTNTTDHKATVVVGDMVAGDSKIELMVRQGAGSVQMSWQDGQAPVIAQNPGFTVRATGSATSFVTGDTIVFSASGSLYTLTQNGTTVLTWDDVTGLYSYTGASNGCGVGLQTNGATNCGLDSFVFEDLYLTLTGTTTTPWAGTTWVGSSANFDPVNHRFLRMREAGGTVYYETSPNASTWNTLSSTPAVFSTSTSYVQLYAGYWGAESSPGTLVLDNLNLAPSWPNPNVSVRPTGRKTGPMALRQRIKRRPRAIYPYAHNDIFADSSLQVTAAPSGDQVVGIGAASSLAATATPTAAVVQGTTTDSALSVTFAPTANETETITAYAGLTLTASPTVTAELTVSIFEENVNQTAAAVPPTALGCYVLGIGGGGTGNYTGGGGGARFDRTWISAASLGSTYTVTRGLGVYHNSGTASVFSSGSITLTAGGGIRGDAGGAGGTATASGITAAGLHNGKAGGAPGYFAPGTPGGDDSTDNVGAGGGGASYNSTPARGGNSMTRSGTAGNSHATPTAAAPGDGGAGGGGNGADGSGAAPGGLYGGGGGGGATSTGAYWGGIGGDGYILVEWVYLAGAKLSTDTALAVTASPSSVITRWQPMNVTEAITVNPTAIGSYGAVAASLQAITASFTADSINHLALDADSSIQITAASSGDSLRNANVDSTQAITAAPSSLTNAAWTAAANQSITANLSAVASYGAVAASTISITATLSALVKWALKANVQLQITPSPTADSVRNANVDSQIQITSGRTSNAIWSLAAAANQQITASPNASEARMAMVDAVLPITVGRLGADTVEFDSVGVGSTGSANGGLTLTWSHTINPLANYVVMGVSILTNGAPTLTAKCGGVTMTLLSSVPTYYPSPGPYSVYLYGLANPPTGVVSMTFQAAGAWDYLAANSASYFNVGTVTEVAVQSITSTSTPSMTIPATTVGQRIVNVWASNSKPASLSFSNATQRSWQPEVDNVNAFLWMGDTPGTGSAITFSATSLTGGWGGIALALQPAPTINVGIGGDVTEAITVSPSSVGVRNAVVNAQLQVAPSTSGDIVVGLHGNAQLQVAPSTSGSAVRNAMVDSTISITSGRTANATWQMYADSTIAIAPSTSSAAVRNAMVDVTQSITATLSSAVKWALKAAVLQQITATPPLSDSSRGQTIGSQQAITVGPTADGSRNQDIDSTQSITVTTPTVIRREQEFATSLSLALTVVTVDALLDNHADAVLTAIFGSTSNAIWALQAAATQTVTVTPTGIASYGATTGASLALTASTLADSIWFATAGADQTITVSPSAFVGRGQGIDSLQTIVVARPSVGSLGQFIDSAQIITTGPLGDISYGATGSALLAVTFAPITSDTLLDNHAESLLAVTANRDANVIWDTTANALLTVTSRRYGTFGRLLNVDAALQVLTRFVGIATGTFGFDAAQTITTAGNAGFVRGQPINATQAITATPAGGIVWHGQIGAPLQITATPLGTAVWNAHANSSLTVTESGLVVVSRGQDIDPALDITVDASGEFTQTMSGDVEQAILALPDTELSLGSTMDSALSLIVTYSADIGEALRGGNFFYFYL